MDSADLVDRYKRYESGTAKIFDYIVGTAREFPEFASILRALRAANKAVKQAKKHADRVTASDVQVSQTYIPSMLLHFDLNTTRLLEMLSI